MPENPYQPPAVVDPTAPDSGAVMIPAFSRAWQIKTAAFIAAIQIAPLLSLAAVFAMNPPHTFDWLPATKIFVPCLLALPIVGLTLPYGIRTSEKQIRRFLTPPGDTSAKYVGLASRGFPLNGGALVLTATDLTFSRQRSHWGPPGYLENLRLPLADIASIRTARGLLHSRLILTLPHGRVVKFRTLRADLWRDAIEEVRHASE